jgi:hypothetical protein
VKPAEPVPTALVTKPPTTILLSTTLYELLATKPVPVIVTLDPGVALVALSEAEACSTKNPELVVPVDEVSTNIW